MIHASFSFPHERVGWNKIGIENLIMSIIHHKAFAELWNEKFDTIRLAELTGSGPRILFDTLINCEGKIENWLILKQYNKIDHSFAILQKINANQQNIFHWFWEHRYYIHCLCGSVGWDSEQEKFIPFKDW